MIQKLLLFELTLIIGQAQAMDMLIEAVERGGMLSHISMDSRVTNHQCYNSIAGEVGFMPKDIVMVTHTGLMLPQNEHLLIQQVVVERQDFKLYVLSKYAHNKLAVVTFIVEPQIVEL